MCEEGGLRVKPEKLYEELISLAGKNNIFLDFTCPKSIVAMSMRTKDGCKVISLPSEDIGPIGRVIGPTVLECFAHEMGHCMTNSFYSFFEPLEGRIQAENKADAWAINFLMPLSEVVCFLLKERAIKQKIAKHFGVGMEFVEKALLYYQRGGDNSEKYN